MSETDKSTKNGILIMVAFFCFLFAFFVGTFDQLDDVSHAFWSWGLSLVGFVAVSVVCCIRTRWIILFVCVAMTITIAVDLRFSYRVQIWHHNSEKGTWYRDSYRRFGNQFHRKMYTDDYSSSGPTADSGSAHGVWVTTNNKSLKSRRDWFFYGEPVTESEWHLREDR